MVPAQDGVNVHDGLARLCAALRRIPAVKPEKPGGAADDEGWWQVSMLINQENPAAWHAVSILSKLFNTDNRQGGRALFHPVAEFHDDDPDQAPILWSLAHLDGSFDPDDAADAILDFLDEHENSATVEE